MTIIETDEEALAAVTKGLKHGFVYAVTPQLIMAMRLYYPKEKVFAIRLNCVTNEDEIINLIYPHIKW